MTMASKKILAADAVQSDPRWALVCARDEKADGTFWYSVQTTGVYCRPSCAARPARPENIAFHESQADAQRAGFRPCKRCKPDAPSLEERKVQWVSELCRHIESAEEAPSLEALAKRAGLSPSYLQRTFKAVTGLSPKAYAAAHRSERMRTELKRSERVTEAIYEAGYASSGRFYEDASAALGMTPSDFRAGGQGHAIRFAIGECSLGSILVAATSRGVCAILLGDDPDALVRDLEARFPHAELRGGDSAFEKLVAHVVGFVEAPSTGLGLPLDIRGTSFQHRVWKVLTEIPVGQTMTYADVARAMGSPRAVRAVASACGQNAVAVAIPCHRVVRTGGELAGYRWGVERKRALLSREAAT